MHGPVVHEFVNQYFHFVLQFLSWIKFDRINAPLNWTAVVFEWTHFYEAIPPRRIPSFCPARQIIG